MTDEQIIKALECCIKGECSECPLCASVCGDEVVMQYAIDLIKRQQAEIYNLKEDLSEYRNMPILTKNDCLIATVEKRTDGKQYHNALLTIKVDEIRAEAYKEFAERLEDISSERLVFEGYGENRVVNVVEYGDIVNLVKELTEESNGE